ncbi:hypothetical protein GY45DRAFT_1325153 [Cubamyces sp. BRFM 1775]|nr:hypothetical protein GY45DRAFT_1325153 [Cubamyces sp. BRFM 1775]
MLAEGPCPCTRYTRATSKHRVFIQPRAHTSSLPAPIMRKAFLMQPRVHILNTSPGRNSAFVATSPLIPTLFWWTSWRSVSDGSHLALGSSGFSHARCTPSRGGVAAAVPARPLTVASLHRTTQCRSQGELLPVRASRLTSVGVMDARFRRPIIELYRCALARLTSASLAGDSSTVRESSSDTFQERSFDCSIMLLHGE